MALRPSKRRKLLSAALGALAAFMATAGAAGLAEDPVPALIILVPASALGLYWLAGALPRSSSLTLTPSEFHVRHLFVRRSWDWDDTLGFGILDIVYPRGGGITLVTFETRDPRERKQDFLQGLAIRGLTRTTTLPDAYGRDPRQLAAVMEACRARFSDGMIAERTPALAADMARSSTVNMAGLALLTIVMTAGSLLLALGGDDTFARVMGWLGVGLFGIGGAATVLVPSLRRRAARSTDSEHPVVAARMEIAYTARKSGLPEATVELVLDAHYAYLEQAPRDRTIEEEVEVAWITSRTDVDADAARAILAAQLDFLRDAGLATDAV